MGPRLPLVKTTRGEMGGYPTCLRRVCRAGSRTTPEYAASRIEACQPELRMQDLRTFTKGPLPRAEMLGQVSTPPKKFVQLCTGHNEE